MEFRSGEEYAVDSKFDGEHGSATLVLVTLENVNTLVTANFGDNRYGLQAIRACTGCNNLYGDSRERWENHRFVRNLETVTSASIQFKHAWYCKISSFFF